jgi:hypothetical protein
MLDEIVRAWERIKTDLHRIGYEEVDWINLVFDLV